MKKYIPNGIRIKELRLALPGSPSQRGFALTLGIHHVTLANIEKGKYGLSGEMAERLANALGVPISNIATEKHEKIKKRLPPDSDIQEIVDFLLDHPTQRKVMLKLVRDFKSFDGD
ncbi:MAG: helix-turn-helix transcriptional regulator [Elusimicrobiales bacterium]